MHRYRVSAYNNNIEYGRMRQLSRNLTAEELLAGLEDCLGQLAAGSKDYELLSALRENIELRRENLRAQQELETVISLNRLLKAQRQARRRGKERMRQRKMKIRRNASKQIERQETRSQMTQREWVQIQQEKTW